MSDYPYIPQIPFGVLPEGSSDEENDPNVYQTLDLGIGGVSLGGDPEELLDSESFLDAEHYPNVYQTHGYPPRLSEAGGVSLGGEKTTLSIGEEASQDQRSEYPKGSGHPIRTTLSIGEEASQDQRSEYPKGSGHPIRTTLSIGEEDSQDQRSGYPMIPDVLPRNFYDQNESNSSYVGGLQSIYNYGLENQDEPLPATLAEYAIDSLGIEFEDDLKQTLITAITGMTGVEAHLYLLEVLNVLDEGDGRKDDVINSQKEDFTDIFIEAGIGDDAMSVDDTLLTAAEVFKDDDDPLDKYNIEFLKSTQDKYGLNDLSPEGEEALHQNGDFTDTLGVTDPTKGQQLEILEVYSLILETLGGIGLRPPLPNFIGGWGSAGSVSTDWAI